MSDAYLILTASLNIYILYHEMCVWESFNRINDVKLLISETRYDTEPLLNHFCPKAMFLLFWETEGLNY